jgi:hypothetical protein
MNILTKADQAWNGMVSFLAEGFGSLGVKFSLLSVTFSHLVSLW